jgi:hypothetical protein
MNLLTMPNLLISFPHTRKSYHDLIIDSTSRSFIMSYTLLFDQGVAFSSNRFEAAETWITRQELTTRYPGVRFHGSARAAQISSAVRIEIGAQITLSSNLSITGDSGIGADAIVEGGRIHSSEINGTVSGGEINHSKISTGSSISGGSINHSILQGHTKVTGGCINRCVLQSATVTGGTLNHSKVRENARVSGGTLNRCVVNQETRFSHGSRQHETIRDLNTQDSVGPVLGVRDQSGTSQVTGTSSYTRFSNLFIGGNSSVQIGNIITPFSPSPSRTRSRLQFPPPMKITDDTYDEVPPEYLIDHLISYDLIHEAIMTPNGDTFNRQVIEKHVNEYGNCPVTREPLALCDLRPNRALQAQITEWKARHVKPVGQENGRVERGVKR